ncbi:HTH-type transcriptional repressor FabR [Catenovulum sp. 2E275]|uniref:HTH-type transcriptional repressor FabR n=1 Tax=Catenovulum sp. 2E275 TaxID=2980497 RepID=UPI0021CF5C88|nr:HTH-type transcriptional repressor FabR [Catenovulum sp. 2E275]MCU4676380.1 HTH-type transcriptional repressor FabR [Catenovulum sp. 2E275]
MPGVRAQQKEKTRRALIQAAFKQLSANHDFSNLSLREVAREAGIAPTSFYRHFKDLDELGLTLVDEAGLLLRQLMRSARQRIALEGSVINTSIETFMDFLTTHESEFRILLQARSGTSDDFRAAVSREIMHFIAELSDYISQSQKCSHDFAFIQAEAMVKLVFNAGAEVIDMAEEQRRLVADRLAIQLRLITNGAAVTIKQLSAS